MEKLGPCLKFVAGFLKLQEKIMLSRTCTKEWTITNLFWEFLVQVDLKSCTEITDGGLKSFAELCPRLTSVDLTKCKKITDAGVKSLAESCTGLTSVNISYCS